MLAIHRAPISWRAKKIALLVESYLFYAAWDPVFVGLLWASTVIDWSVARAMMGAVTARRRKALLWISLGFNLGLLAYFKYAGFFTTGITVPIGISFYTFMTMSYVIDVYLRRAEPARNFLDYALYVTFFPHLVSGPIVRAPELVPQFETPRQATRDQLGWGLALLVLGLFQKVVLADAFLGPVADRVYAMTTVSTVDAWVGTLAFAGQIACDFAGYSTCAIGVALCLGFYLPQNFRYPYGAIGFSDFWRRWHISLSTWLRDYVYIPLGGNRSGPTRTHVNLMLTMLIGGLWHGASWTFVAWGGLHGAYLVVERIVRRVVPASPIWDAALVKFVLGALTFAAVCVTWVCFRAPTFHAAKVIAAAMMGAGQGAVHADLLAAVIPVVGIVAVHAVMRDKELEGVVEKTPWPVTAGLLAAMSLALILFNGIDRAFIYFQF